MRLGGEIGFGNLDAAQFILRCWLQSKEAGASLSIPEHP